MTEKKQNKWNPYGWSKKPRPFIPWNRERKISAKETNLNTSHSGPRRGSDEYDWKIEE